ncbi:S-ribosylhomocysteine lyase [Lederbergia citrea]|uniref:S-ribosylhomocysteine lyase n=1 Tax=Lederbergia citrea TaxID=2833581 RepID=A0A942URU8_9BACI|nr:S-ribosylhomocysteine lyase [Lederbergia citrea]MBS4179749.1 S-ribosylhomocysteine lyase [Lederbergia citrea]MBS4206402.1 S-ribosylhomocysteine lyase [Lederbergia citrea]MBS4225022.1 S-ribosylhomocysteine lyase [Lederbergia citrea]
MTVKKTMNVESFNLDHTKVKAPYIRLAGMKEGRHGDVIRKYDLRFCQPNKEHLEMPALHSLEHMMAEFSRNHSDQIVDISPMGCQTGYYLSMVNHDDYEDILSLVEKTLNDVLTATEVPACNEVQCGWAASHSLEGAKEIAKKMLAHRDEWTEVF